MTALFIIQLYQSLIEVNASDKDDNSGLHINKYQSLIEVNASR